MKLVDIFENMRPVATVWKKRGSRIERGRISRYAVDLTPLTNIEVCHEKEKESAGEHREDASRLSSQSREVDA